jgi:hypothetical protein
MLQHSFKILLRNYYVYTMSLLNLFKGRAIAEAVSRCLPTAAARVRARVWQVGFVVDKMASGQVFSEYFDFPCQPYFIPPTSSSPQSPGTGTIGQVLAAVPRGPSMDSISQLKKKLFKITLYTTYFHRHWSSSGVFKSVCGDCCVCFLRF